MSSIFFVSDVHLGTRYSKADPAREAHLEEWIRDLRDRASHLFLLGDIFEFWMEHRHVVPKHHFGVLSALYELRRSGVEIHYLRGNHDFNLGTFFDRSLGIVTHDGPLELTLQGKRVLLLHGDGVDPADWKYRLVRRVLHHRLANRAWKLIHPDLGMRIALGVGKASREAGYDLPGPGYENEMRKYLRKGYDLVIHGHIHQGFVKHHPEGILVNTGEWVTRMEYVEMKDGACELKRYSPASSRRMDSSFS
jgi:UDP-2,3-diacylglucosamine hydrolase